MSNNLTSADPSILPYYVATYKDRSVAIKRDANYEVSRSNGTTDTSNTTIKLVQKSIAKLRGANAQDILISTTLSDYGGALVQISEEIWPDVVSHVKTVEVALEGDDDTASGPTNMKTGNVTWTARHEHTGTATATDENVLDPPTTIASCPPSSDPANTSTDPQDSLSVTVRTPSHALLELNDLRPSTKIEDVKSLIEDRYGMPATLQSLGLLGKPLDNSMTLAQSDVTVSSIVDLSASARQCIIYLRDGPYDGYGRRLSYQNVKVQFSLNRVWELAALRHPTVTLPKDYVQSVSWNVDVAANGTLTEHGSGTKLSYLFWDGV
ncbi:hypothetical protein FRC10_005444 [Ceratobasidium sp. 414]|nr:hypothetical protein FRC10_005444 [Ceratobasidium sp. 414]